MTPSESTIRLMRAREAADLKRFRELQLEYEESLPPDLRHSLPELAALEHVYADPNAAFLAYDGDDPAGCVAVTELDASTSVLKRLYVKPSYRGRGIARGLVDEVIAFSRERGHRRVVLDTERTRLSAAYQLYLSLGFVDCEPYGPVDYASPTYMQLLLENDPGADAPT
jgi:GNAT superfamily N-acetyltransferase